MYEKLLFGFKRTSINYEKKEMIPLTKEEKKMHRRQKDAIYAKKELVLMITIKIPQSKRSLPLYWKIRGAVHNICNLRYKIPKEIPVVFHNGSTYDYHFIIKELAEEFEGEFECLGENTEKYITFSVPIKKEITKIDKDGNGKIMKISCKIKFIDSFRFMPSSLSSLVDNLSEGLHSDKCTDCKSCLDYMITKDEQLFFGCFECKKNYRKDFNKFILLLIKGVYPYEYMDNWERFNETSLPDKDVFLSSLNMENITDVDYRHANNVL